MVKSQTLRLSWRNEAGRTYSFSIDNPRNDLTQTEIESFMDLVINKNVILSTGGALVAKSDAHLINTEDTDLYTPAV